MASHLILALKERSLGNSAIRHLHISHNAPYLPHKILHNLCFSFLLGQEKLKTMLVQNFGGQIRCIVGDVQVAYVLLYVLSFNMANKLVSSIYIESNFQPCLTK